MNITCAIIDDEPLAIDLLKSYVLRTPFLKLENTFSNAIDATDQLTTNPVNLVFCDIQMPDLDGLSLARMLPETTRIIFTTAFSQYALDSYKNNALDYLLKPISYQDFLTAANKARDWFSLLHKATQPTADQEPIDAIFIKSDYKLLKIQLADILYIEGLKDYVKIYTQSAPRPILSLTSMKSLEEHLPQDHFMRIHRSYIVNMQHVEVVERGQIILGTSNSLYQTVTKTKSCHILNTDYHNITFPAYRAQKNNTYSRRHAAFFIKFAVWKNLHCIF